METDWERLSDLLKALAIRSVWVGIGTQFYQCVADSLSEKFLG